MIPNFFNENESNLLHRFSIIMCALFIYYAVTYYGLLKYHLQCHNIPNLGTLMLLIIFHIVQVVIVKKLHAEDRRTCAWITVFLPVFLYLCILKYYDYMRKEQAKKMNMMLYQMQQQNQPILPPVTQQLSNNPMDVQQMMQMNPNGMPMNQMNPEFPAYGDYVSQFNSMNQPPQNFIANNPYAQPYGGGGNSMGSYGGGGNSFTPF